MQIIESGFPPSIIEAVKNTELANKVTHTIWKEDNTLLGYIIQYKINKLLRVYPIRELDVGQFYAALEIQNLSEYSVNINNGNNDLTLVNSIDSQYLTEPIENLIANKLSRFKNYFNTLKIRPKVPVLSDKFRIDAGSQDIENLKSYLSLLLDNNETSGTIKDADDNFQTVSTTDLKNILKDIRSYGLNLYQLKWQKEAEINSATIENIKSISILLSI